MSLTHYEQRQLEQIEAALIAETPGLNRLLRSAPMGEHRQARLRRSWLVTGVGLTVLGLAVVVLGIGSGRAALVGVGLFLLAMSLAAVRWGPRLRGRAQQSPAAGTGSGNLRPHR